MRIEDDNLSGAAILTQQALYRIESLVEGAYSSREAFLSALEQECTTISESHKSMPSIRTVLFQVYADAEKGKTASQAIHLARKSIATQIQNNRNAESSLIAYGCSLITRGMTILTHSRSSTVEKILFHAYEKTPFRLIVTESRPNNEGRLLAYALAERGIPTTFVVDAAAGRFNPHMVLVGADAVTREYVVNKIGTLLLAAHFPLYVACTTQKFTSEEVEIQEENPDEVLLNPPSEITVENFYFDRTPLDMVTAFVTERGILTPEEVHHLL